MLNLVNEYNTILTMQSYKCTGHIHFLKSIPSFENIVDPDQPAPDEAS